MNEKNIHPEAIDDEAMDSVTGGIFNSSDGDFLRNFNPGIPDGMKQGMGKKKYKVADTIPPEIQKLLDGYKPN